MTVKRGILAILLGILTSILSFYVVATSLQMLSSIKLLQFYTIHSIPTFIMLLLLLHLPIAIGGFIAGIITRHKGWIYGLATGAIFWWLLFILGILTGDLLVQPQQPYSELLFRWQDVLALCASFITAGMASGYLGQALAKDWHKRS